MTRNKTRAELPWAEGLYAENCGQGVRPRHPGLYWFHSELIPLEIMVEVYENNGQLTVWWLNHEQPVATLKGSWRGPILTSTGPGSPTTT